MLKSWIKYLTYYTFVVLLTNCNSQEKMDNIQITPEEIEPEISVVADSVDESLIKLEHTFHPNGNTKFYGYKIDSILHGYSKTFYESEVVSSQGEYYLGEKIKWWEYFYPSGQIKSQGHYSNNLKSRFWSEFDDAGNKVREAYYEAGEKRGMCRTYFTNGNVQEEGIYLGDDKDGWFSFYNEDGSLREESAYFEGRKEGGARYYQNGVLIQEGAYRDNKKVGIWKSYDANGYVILETDEDKK